MQSTHFLFVALVGVGCAGSSGSNVHGGGAREASPPSSISTIAVAAADAATAPTVPQAPSIAPRFHGADLLLEGLHLGAKVGVFENVYYETLCDTDPINDKTRAVWFHAGKPCRDAKALPENTVLAIFTTYTSSKSPYDTVEAIAWFGDWPNVAGNFPVKIGVRLTEAEKALGSAQKLFDSKVKRNDLTLTVHLHSGGTYSITRGDTVVGYCVGAMGRDPEKEEWRGLFSNVSRYRSLGP